MYKPGMILVKKNMGLDDVIKSIRLVSFNNDRWEHEVIGGAERYLGLKLFDRQSYLENLYDVARTDKISFIAYNYKNVLVKR